MREFEKIRLEPRTKNGCNDDKGSQRLRFEPRIIFLSPLAIWVEKTGFLTGILKLSRTFSPSAFLCSKNGKQQPGG